MNDRAERMVLVWRHVLLVAISEAGSIEGCVWSLANQAGKCYEPRVKGGQIVATLQVAEVPPGVEYKEARCVGGLHPRLQLPPAERIPRWSEAGDAILIAQHDAKLVKNHGREELPLLLKPKE